MSLKSPGIWTPILFIYDFILVIDVWGSNERQFQTSENPIEYDLN